MEDSLSQALADVPLNLKSPLYVATVQVGLFLLTSECTTTKTHTKVIRSMGFDLNAHLCDRNYEKHIKHTVQRMFQGINRSGHAEKDAMLCFKVSPPSSEETQKYNGIPVPCTIPTVARATTFDPLHPYQQI
jgi:hypothetical protein